MNAASMQPGLGLLHRIAHETDQLDALQHCWPCIRYMPDDSWATDLAIGSYPQVRLGFFARRVINEAAQYSGQDAGTRAPNRIFTGW